MAYSFQKFEYPLFITCYLTDFGKYRRPHSHKVQYFVLNVDTLNNSDVPHTKWVFFSAIDSYIVNMSFTSEIKVMCA